MLIFFLEPQDSELIVNHAQSNRVLKVLDSREHLLIR